MTRHKMNISIINSNFTRNDISHTQSWEKFQQDIYADTCLSGNKLNLVVLVLMRIMFAMPKYV